MRDEARYPIYAIDVDWTEDDKAGERIRNTARLYRMYREDQDPAALERWAREEWWPEYVTSRLTDKNPSEPKIAAKLNHRESWCLSWFEHWTFDDGQTDREALDSFEAYVRRHERYQDWPHNDRTDEELRARGIEYRICLMGAEDRWRWSGGGTPDAPTDPPCRCEHCKAQGKLRIGH